MGSLPAPLLVIVSFVPCILLGGASIVALGRRTYHAPILGGVSVFLVILMALASSPLTMDDSISYGLMACPGTVGMVAGLFLRREAPRPGHCLHCGYNLTGNTSGVCPECGTKIAPR